MLSPTKESEYVHSCFILLDGLYSSHSDQLAWNHNPKSLILRARKKKNSTEGKYKYKYK